MSKAVFAFILLCSVWSTNAQDFKFSHGDSKGYRASTRTPDYSVGVSLDETNHSFRIELSYQATHDMIDVADIAYGRYTVSENYYFFTDWASGWKMEAVLGEDGALVFSKGYSFMNGIPLTPSDGSSFPLDVPFSFGFAEAKRSEFLESGIRSFILPVGTFGNPNLFSLIKLSPNQSFIYEMMGFPLLKGKWTFQNNVIRLQDDDITVTPFYILYDGDSLTPMLLPGVSKVVTLQFIPEDSPYL